MLKKVLFGLVATALVAATTLPVQFTPATAGTDDLQGRGEGEI